jgi:uncharacterized protein YciI
MPLFVLTYEYVPDVLEKRTPFRAEHLANAKAWNARGKLKVLGAFDPPSDGALGIFDVASAAEVEDFVKADPYVKHGIVTRHRVRPWSTAVGTV